MLRSSDSVENGPPSAVVHVFENQTAVEPGISKSVAAITEPDDTRMRGSVRLWSCLGHFRTNSRNPGRNLFRIGKGSSIAPLLFPSVMSYGLGRR